MADTIHTPMRFVKHPGVSGRSTERWYGVGMWRHTDTIYVLLIMAALTAATAWAVQAIG